MKFDGCLFLLSAHNAFLEVCATSIVSPKLCAPVLRASPSPFFNTPWMFSLTRFPLIHDLWLTANRHEKIKFRRKKWAICLERAETALGFTPGTFLDNPAIFLFGPVNFTRSHSVCLEDSSSLAQF